MKERLLPRYSTSILRYPTGKFGLAGSVPRTLTLKVWDTEDEVVNALLSIGVTLFQLADCSWYGEK